MRNIILDIQGLSPRYGSLAAVDDVSLTVNSSEIFGLLGSNGAGKTTMIKMLATLLPPSSGEACVAGFSITSQPVDVRRSIGYVPQAVSVDGSLTGYENLLIFAKLYDLPRNEQKARIDEALELMGLSADGNRMVNQYSGGMVRRLEIAQSTLHRPRVLFLDEPTVGLDPIARDAAWKHLVDLRATYGTTLFFTTHYMDEAEAYCDRIAIMHQGKIAALGTSKELEASYGGTWRLAVEAGVTQGWHRYVGDHGDVLGLDRFGASAPAPIVMREFGFTVENVCAKALSILERQHV